MNLIFLGPPGAGKGTQAKLVADKFSFIHISTGDMLRETIQSGSILGNVIKKYISSGQLVPDNVVIEAVKHKLAQKDCSRGFVLDGFPRTVTQAKILSTFLADIEKKIDFVVYINLDSKEIINRLSSRRICSSCGKSYNLIFEPPKIDNKCDKCGSNIIQRIDDNSETILKRINAYNDFTSPLIEYYKNLNILKTVEGATEIEEVFKGISDFIQK